MRLEERIPVRLLQSHEGCVHVFPRSRRESHGFTNFYSMTLGRLQNLSYLLGFQLKNGDKNHYLSRLLED